MSYGGTESYAVNTGQVATFHDAASTPGTITFGTPAIENCPAASYASAFFAIPAAGDPPAAAYAAGTWVSTTVPGGQTYANFEVGFVRDNLTYVLADCVSTTGTIITGAVLLTVGGTHNESIPGGGFSNTIPANSRIALAISGNTISVHLFTAGAWVTLCSCSSVGIYDFTAPGALVGWRPFIGMSSSPNASSQTFSQLQWGPLSDLSNTGFNPPTSLGGAIVPGPQVALTWNASVPFPGNPLTAPVGYNVYRNGTLLTNVTVPGQTFFTDTTVIAGLSYTYTVAAANADLTDASGLSAPLVINTSPVFLYGRFSPANAFAPVMLINVKGIKPKLYAPVINPNMRSRR